MTSICLGLMVRDAQQTIGRCIEAALRLEQVDRAVVIDTGSTDDTIAVIEEALGGLPSEFYESGWVGHAHNRSELLEKARGSGADYCLMLDADMELVLDGELPPLTADAYMLRIRDRGMEYPLPLLTANRLPYYYAGVAHSYLACHAPAADPEILPQITLLDHGGGGGRPGKIKRDAELLGAEVAKNPRDRRSWFYLAQSFRDLDRVEDAIAAYKMRASLGGWDEEVYNALREAGSLLCEHIDAREGMQLLLDAWKLMPHRAEALRALGNVAHSVADKLPFPENDVLFVRPSAYKQQDDPSPGVPEPPPFPEVWPPYVTSAPRYRATGSLHEGDVSAILVTRGNVDMNPILDSLLEYGQVVIWDNSKRPHDYKAFGRYAALAEVEHPVVYWQDDDVIVPLGTQRQLLHHYEPGRLVCNMDADWIDGAGYSDKVGMQGAGSLCDASLPANVWEHYLEHYPWDDDALTEADFVFGTLVPFTVVDLPFHVREFADDPDRLYTQPGQTERKWKIINRCLEIKAMAAAA